MKKYNLADYLEYGKVLYKLVPSISDSRLKILDYDVEHFDGQEKKSLTFYIL
jgi:hypothetical protein